MKLNRRGLIGTIIYHLALILLLVFAGLTFPVPPPEEEGILVNFGTDDTGFGDFEPMGDDQNAGEPDQPIVEQSPEVSEDIPEETVEQVREIQTQPDPTPVDNTQDVEETRVKEKPQPTEEELRKQREEEQRRIEEERIRQEELEAERIRKEEEQKRLEEERKRQEQIEQINNRGQNVFGRQGVGEESGSEGEAGGDGNQGVTDGTPDADRYGVGGGLGDNQRYGLGSRKALGNLPKPQVDNCNVTQRMEVKVEIQVDREGNVVGAMVLNATYQDGCIWDAVVAAAKKTKFTSDPNALNKQTGWIRYIIEP